MISKLNKPQIFNGDFTVSVGQRYGMLFCSWILCYLIGSVIMGVMMYSGTTPAKLRIGMVIQDIIMFVIPSIVTAVIITRRPADFLMVNRRPALTDMSIVALILLVSAPVMNAVIAWNQSLHLPENLNWLEKWMIESEQSANSMLSMMTGGSTVGGLIISLLLIGLLAGFSEELFFRGALQRILTTTPINGHLAVWLSAIIFSAIHLQFFGFVPRLLLGAFFGYLAWWSGTLWLAVFAHVFNNCMAVVALWLKTRSDGAINLDIIGQNASSSDLAMVAASVAFTLLWIVILYRRLNRSKTIRNQ